MAVDHSPFPMMFVSCGVEEAKVLFSSLRGKGSKLVGDWPLLYGSIGNTRVCLHFAAKDPSHTRGKLLVISHKKPPHGELREWIEEVLGPLPPAQKGDDAA